MVTGILNALGIGKPKEVIKAPVIVKPKRPDDAMHMSQNNIWNDAEILLGKEALAEINTFINNSIKFYYGAHPELYGSVKQFKSLATPKFEYLPEYYRRIMYQLPPKNGWGLYTMSADPFGNLFQKVNRLSVVSKQLDAKGGVNYGKPLGDVVERIVNKYYKTHYFSDVRHLLHLIHHPNEIPLFMKNGKGNLFAGTTVLVHSKPHMLVASWKKDTFSIELVPLTIKLEDTAQFVMIHR